MRFAHTWNLLSKCDSVTLCGWKIPFAHVTLYQRLQRLSQSHLKMIKVMAINAWSERWNAAAKVTIKWANPDRIRHSVHNSLHTHHLIKSCYRGVSIYLITYVHHATRWQSIGVSTIGRQCQKVINFGFEISKMPSHKMKSSSMLALLFLLSMNHQKQVIAVNEHNHHHLRASGGGAPAVSTISLPTTMR